MTLYDHLNVVKEDLALLLQNKKGYYEILKKYIEYIEENNVKGDKNNYDFLYPNSKLNPINRKLINEHWGSFESIRQIASDLDIELSLDYTYPFKLNISNLDSHDFLAFKSIKKCSFTIHSYKSNEKLNIFLSLFHENLKSLGIQTSIQIEQEV